MRFAVVVPENIEFQVTGWNLSWEIERQIWLELGRRWSDEDLAKCSWLTPGFIFLRTLEFPDEEIPCLVHLFRFWLTFGGQNELHVYQADYEQTGKWDEPPEGERDWGGFYTPE